MLLAPLRAAFLAKVGLHLLGKNPEVARAPPCPEEAQNAHWNRQDPRAGLLRHSVLKLSELHPVFGHVLWGTKGRKFDLRRKFLRCLQEEVLTENAVSCDWVAICIYYKK